MFLDYQNQLDLRVARNFRFGTLPHPGLRRHLQRAERRHGGARQRDLRHQPGDQRVADAAALMDARYLRFGMQMSF